jgi:hypothetical protein
MSNIFQDVLNDAKGVEQQLLGPDYNYVGKIKTPGQLGVSTDGTISAMTKDISALINYTEVLVTGQGDGTTVGGPLGDKFFLQTGQTCKDVDSGEEVTRSIYINNIPDGSIPFITTALGGEKFDTFEGLIPGAMGNVTALNPFAMMQSFLSGSVPECKYVNYPVVVDAGNPNTQTGGYVTLTDIQNEGFENNNSFNKKKRKNIKKKAVALPDDHISQFFFVGLSIIGVVVLYELMQK